MLIVQIDLKFRVDKRWIVHHLMVVLFMRLKLQCYSI